MKNQFILKTAFTRAVAVLICIIVSYFFAFSETYWILVATFIVMQTAVGVSVRQGLQHWLTLLAGMIGGTMVQGMIAQFWYAFIVGVGVFCLGGFFQKHKSPRGVLSPYFIFSIAFLFSLLGPTIAFSELRYRVYDAAIGGVIGILVSLFIFPSRVDVEFRQSILPIFDWYSRYLTAIMDSAFGKVDAEKKAATLRNTLEMKLQRQKAAFPVWIYEPGLSIPLQSGHRHFLIMVERISEILFSLHYEVRHPLNVPAWQSLEAPIYSYINEVNHVFNAIATVLSLQKLTEAVSDLKEELYAVEKAFNSLLPASFELLDSSNEYWRMAAVIEGLKDLRLTLLNLGNALRTAVHSVTVER